MTPTASGGCWNRTARQQIEVLTSRARAAGRNCGPAVHALIVSDLWDGLEHAYIYSDQGGGLVESRHCLCGGTLSLPLFRRLSNEPILRALASERRETHRNLLTARRWLAERDRAVEIRNRGGKLGTRETYALAQPSHRLEAIAYRLIDAIEKLDRVIEEQTWAQHPITEEDPT